MTLSKKLSREVGFEKYGTLLKSVVHLLYKSVVHQNLYHSLVQKCGTKWGIQLKAVLHKKKPHLNEVKIVVHC